jgi:type VII secretion protein EccE
MSRNRKRRGGHASRAQSPREQARHARKDARKQKRADRRVARAAGRRFGLRLSGGYLLLFSAAVAAGILAATATGIPAAGLVGLVAGVLLICTYDGTTWAEWLRRRRRMATAMTPVVVASSDGAAVSLALASASSDATSPTGVRGTGSDEAVVWMRVVPARPFHYSRVSTESTHLGASSGDVTTDHPAIDLSVLEPLMTQGELMLQRIEVITEGMHSMLPTTVARSVATISGEVPAPLAGNTYLKVTMRLDDAHPAVQARAIDGDFAVGTHRAVLSAVARIRVRVEGMGLKVTVLTPEQGRQVSEEMLTWLGDSAEEPHWDHLGGDVAGGVVSVVPSTGPDNQGDWLAVEASRTFAVSRMERGERGRLGIGYFLTYANHDTPVPSLARPLKLRVLRGQQIQAASQIIPAAAPEPLQLPLSPVGSPQPAAYIGGLGVYLGTTQARHPEKVFVQVHRGTGAVLHIAGPVELAEQFLLRLSAQSVTVDVRIPDTGFGGSMWPRFVAGMKSPNVTFDANEDADVVVVAPGGEHGMDPAQTVIVVSAASPTYAPEGSLVRSGDDLVLTTGPDQVRVPWVVKESEKRYMLPPD